MLRILFSVIILMHGLIHFMGFAKAFNYGDMKQLSIPVSKPVGVLWMITSSLFIIALMLFILKKEYWWVIGIVAAIISQIVIVLSWKDAKYGTISNIIVLIVAVLSCCSNRFESSFRKDVKENLLHNNQLTAELVTEADLENLPLPVRRYLIYAGVIGKPRVKNMKVVMDVQMREKGKDFFTATSLQYNFFDEPARLFFMKAKMFGITVPGYHHYINGNAVMDIRFAGLFNIVKKEGDVMNKTETVTVLNDMCLMAPATLIDKRIKWEAIDNNTAKAIFSNHNSTISAILYFNEQGQLINFLSTDRTEVNMMKNFPFTTPVHSYKNIEGLNLFDEGDAEWEYPDGKFVYGKFKLKEIEYNIAEIK